LKAQIILPKTDVWRDHEDPDYEKHFDARAVDIVERDGKPYLRIVIIDEEDMYPIEEFDKIVESLKKINGNYTF
jgi:protein-tyrosine phosphatase